MSESARLVAAGGVLALVCYAAFGDKPVHVDDPHYVLTARQILHEPLAPYGFTLNWEGKELPAEVYASYHPPLWPAILAVPMRLFGEREAALHLAQIPFLAAALTATALLARAMQATPWTAFAVLATGPAFLVSSTTLMPDIPALALFLSGLLCFLSLKRSSWYGACGALLLFLAGLMKLSYLPVLAVIAVALVLSRPPRARGMAWLSVPVLLLSCWPLANLLLRGEDAEFYRLPSWEHAWTPFALGAKLAYSLTALAVSVVHPGLWLCLLGGYLQRGRRSLFLASAVATVLLFACFALAGVWQPLRHPVWAATPSGLSAAWALAGTFFFACWLGCFAWESFASRKSRGTGRSEKLLVVWVAIVLLAAMVGAPFASVRYVLPAAPALAVMVAMETARWLRWKWGVWAVAATVVATAHLGLSAAHADLAYARCVRDLAASAGEKLRAEGIQGYLTAHWGFQYYGEALGIRVASVDGMEPGPGDAVIIPYAVSRHELRLRSGLTTTPWLSLECAGGVSLVRTVDPRCSAGFYGLGWLPYAFRRGSLEGVLVRRVVLASGDGPTSR